MHEHVRAEMDRALPAGFEADPSRPRAPPGHECDKCGRPAVYGMVPVGQRVLTVLGCVACRFRWILEPYDVNNSNNT